MNRRITDWLRSDSLPRNLFELLGHPLFDRNREAMLQTLRASNRGLLDYQSHPEAAVSKRAMFLLTELGRARGILEESARFDAHFDELAKTIRGQFVAERGPLALQAGNELAAWLGLAYGVSSADADRVATTIRGNSPAPMLLPKPDRSRFSAFKQSAADELIEAEILEVAPVPAPPPVVGVPLDLPDDPPPRQPPRLRKPMDLEPVEPAPKRKRPARPQAGKSSMLVPLAIAGGVLFFVAVAVAIAIVASGGSPDRARNDAPTEIKLPPPTPNPEPKEPTKSSEDVSPKANPWRNDPSNTEPKKEPEKKEPPKKNSNPPAVQTTPPDDPKPPPKPPTPPKPPDDPKPMPKIDPDPKDTFDRKDWVAAEGGKPAFLIKDVYARVHSASIQKLTDQEKKVVSEPLLVVWIEVANQGTELRRYRRLMDWQKMSDEYFQYVSLRDDSKTMANDVKRAYWLNFNRTRIAELPGWFDDEGPNRMIPPGRQVLVPIVFEPPVVPSKDYTLKINAIRFSGERGSGTEYGELVLRVRDEHWKKAPPKP